jgi:hypothetical protein
MFLIAMIVLLYTQEEIRGMQCFHSNAAMKFFPSWDDYWTLADIEETDQSYNVFCNQTNGDESKYYWNKRVGNKPVLVEHFLDRKPREQMPHV